MTKSEMTQAIFARKAALGLGWKAIADKIGVSPVWITSACLGQNSMPDGIMRAIDFTMHIDKVADPKGDRVKITMNGKFLPYKTW